MGKTLQERLYEKIDQRGPDECWNWTAYVDTKGYGQISVDGKAQHAHRIVYQLANNLTDEQMPVVVRHKCDNPSCCNPNHLEGGTKLDNSRDMVKRGRSNRGTDKHTNILTEQQVLDIRSRYTGRRGQQAEMAKQYGVIPQTINGIIHRVIWNHI